MFPDAPITKKGLEMPMGSGKGDGYCCSPVKKGKILLKYLVYQGSWLRRYLLVLSKNYQLKQDLLLRVKLNNKLYTLKKLLE